MAKYPAYKYEFQIDDETFLLAVGESKESKYGVLVKVDCIKPCNERMTNLWIKCDSVRTHLEYGQRTPNDKQRKEFTKWKMSYPSEFIRNGVKMKEIPIIHKSKIA